MELKILSPRFNVPSELNRSVPLPEGGRIFQGDGVQVNTEASVDGSVGKTPTSLTYHADAPFEARMDVGGTVWSFARDLFTDPSPLGDVRVSQAKDTVTVHLQTDTASADVVLPKRAVEAFKAASYGSVPYGDEGKFHDAALADKGSAKQRLWEEALATHPEDRAAAEQQYFAALATYESVYGK